MEMMHQVWSAGLHDAANCFQDALEAKWERDAKKVIATNGDKLRAMTDEEMAKGISRMAHCVYCPVRDCTFCTDEECKAKWLSWLKAPVEEGENNG